MRWFFLTLQQEQIPTAESQLATLVQQGILRPQTLVWHQGQADWQSLGELKPELFTANQTLRSDRSAVTTASAPLQVTAALVRQSAWILTAGICLQLFGLLVIIAGVLSALNAYKEWHQVAASLEGAKPTLSLPLIIVTHAVEALGAIGLFWLGSLLVGAAAKLRHGQATGERSLTEAGLKALGDFFTLLVISFVIAAILWLIATLATAFSLG